MMLAALLLACVLDRTGQSITTAMRNEIIQNGSQIENLERQFDRLESRVSQVEDITRARGQEDIMNMESMDQVRIELANFRNEMEMLKHSYDQTATAVDSQGADTVFRLAWLEERADSIERQLGLVPPPPPDPPVSRTDGDSAATDPGISSKASPIGKPKSPGQPSESGEEAAQAPPAVSEPEPALTTKDLLKLAESHLASGRELAAENVLKRIIEQKPGPAIVSEALYRLAEAAYNSGDFKLAISRFQEVIDKDESNKWSAWALLRQGECFEELKQPGNARLFYEDVIRLYPKSAAAKDAKKKLK
jgi:TolA-binding protein